MSGMEAHHERRADLHRLLRSGRKRDWLHTRVDDSPVLPVAELLASPATPCGDDWWETEWLPAKWLQPAAESVGRSK